MSRLTKEIREQMARKLVAYRYADEAKELVRLNRTLADRAHADLYPPEILVAMQTIGAKFPGAFDKRAGFTVNAGGYRFEIGGEMYGHWVQFVQEKHEGYLSVGYRSVPGLTDPVLTEEVKAYADRYRAFGDVCQTAYYEALSVLNTMTTGKKLAAAWPEAMEVIGDLIPEDERTLPVVQVAEVNKKFKLPPKSKKAA